MRAAVTPILQPSHPMFKVAGQLAAEFASNEGGPYEKLERW